MTQNFVNEDLTLNGLDFNSTNIEKLLISQGEDEEFLEKNITNSSPIKQDMLYMLKNYKRLSHQLSELKFQTMRQSNQLDQISKQLGLLIESKLEEKANDKRFAYYPDSFKANDLKDLYNIVKQDDDDFFKKL